MRPAIDKNAASLPGDAGSHLITLSVGCITGRFNTSQFTSDMFSEGGSWLGNPDAVLQGIQTAGGDPINNGTQGMVVMRLSNARYALS